MQSKHNQQTIKLKAKYTGNKRTYYISGMLAQYILNPHIMQLR